MSKLEYLIIHCTDTPENCVVTKEDIIEWHTADPPQGNGWSKVGYTDMIHLDGTLENLTPYDQDDEVDGYEITNGVRGKNSISRHVVYVGGKDNVLNAFDTRTKAQRQALATYVKFMILRHPDIKIGGHYQFDKNKVCPSFRVDNWLLEIGVQTENIYCP